MPKWESEKHRSWIQMWEELHGLAERGIMVEVEHVKAHRTRKEKEHMSQ